MTNLDGLERIVVVFDGTPASGQALALACQQAKRVGGSVNAVYVIEVKRALPVDVESEAEVVKAKAILSQARAMAQEVGCAAETVLRQGRNAGQIIVEEARRQNAQLIVLGVSHQEHLGAFDLGPTVAYVLKKAPCSVWLCQQPPEPTG